MSTSGAGPGRNRAPVRRFLPPGVVWAAALLAAPFLNADGAAALAWGAGAAVLVSLFPWALVRFLNLRGDLRQGLSRLGAPPVILGAAGACYMVLLIIRWTEGPRALAAVLFSMIAAYAITALVSRVMPLEWKEVTYAAAAVVLPVLLLALFPGTAGLSAAAVAAGLCAAALLYGRRTTAGRTAAAAAVGLAAGGGVFLWLLAYSL
ncbi:hypothetical protein KKR91_11505 [Arthrobacter jiangjiafuii]|uniref:Uncharacterized protein n=1 Tax=Arthrobacter jiangjiafuii TaxID=2817475 RepID=A0A975M375_9MICC|nr:hypothetical protein [Arthrobacter jiangjiafuii]MBP3043626.1 hypothetical protein [Arthrobacter jiangjiafuii]QWC09133.1 hypothetical protein KKR91_11505 [Arthrobacter jiangjiafuii]